ncbi:MAG: hypothetical protein KME31_04360 [Tolypothrix carrinoi HA7290-LM1]|jgi:hypothetical protein|nr:hypothetical protein [Tolypothrix carrinoi HA7290-LM1]
MLSSLKPKAIVIRESKIVHKSSIRHSSSRFVTEEAVTIMFNINFEDIYVVECWRYIVYVHAKGVSKFVSYADFPPIVGVEPPTTADFIKWRKRWKKQNEPGKSCKAPELWVKFFLNEFWRSPSEAVLYTWGKLVALIKFAFHEERLQELRDSYRQQSKWLVVSG